MASKTFLATLLVCITGLILLAVFCFSQKRLEPVKPQQISLSYTGKSQYFKSSVLLAMIVLVKNYLFNFGVCVCELCVNATAYRTALNPQ